MCGFRESGLDSYWKKHLGFSAHVASLALNFVIISKLETAIFLLSKHISCFFHSPQNGICGSLTHLDIFVNKKIANLQRNDLWLPNK